MAKVTYDEIMTELRTTSAATYEKYDSHSYACGMYEAMIASMVLDLPKHKQLEVIRSLKAAQERMKIA